MKTSHSASAGNALLWITAIIAAAVLLRGTEQVTIMIVILVVAGGVSIALVSNALRQDRR
jgi:hypothetical protein